MSGLKSRGGKAGTSGRIRHGESGKEKGRVELRLRLVVEVCTKDCKSDEDGWCVAETVPRDWLRRR